MDKLLVSGLNEGDWGRGIFSELEGRCWEGVVFFQISQFLSPHFLSSRVL